MEQNAPQNVKGKQQQLKSDRTVDPRDLVREPGYTDQKTPEEVLSNPAVTPQTLQEPSDLRDDLRQ